MSEIASEALRFSAVQTSQQLLTASSQLCLQIATIMNMANATQVEIPQEVKNKVLADLVWVAEIVEQKGKQ